MKGHLEPRGKNTWRLAVYLGRNADGRRRYTKRTFNGTKRDAQRALTFLLAEVLTGGYAEPSNERLADYLRSWLKNNSANWSPRTLDVYAWCLKKHVIPQVGHVKLGDLTPRHIQKVLTKVTDEGLSSTTAHHVYRVISSALISAVRLGILSRNPCAGVTPPKVAEHLIELPRREDVESLLQVAGGDTLWGVPIDLALRTGLRRGEILGLKWQDIELEERYLTVRRTLKLARGKIVEGSPKTKAGRRRVELTPESVKALRSHLASQGVKRLALGAMYADDGYVFTGDFGGPLHPDSFTHAFKRIARRAGIAGSRLHDLRHWHATYLIAQGEHLKVIQERLGHANIAITGSLYGHVAPGLQRQAADKFDGALAARA